MSGEREHILKPSHEEILLDNFNNSICNSKFLFFSFINSNLLSSNLLLLIILDDKLSIFLIIFNKLI